MPRTTRPNYMTGPTYRWGLRAESQRRGYTSMAAFAKQTHITQAIFLRIIQGLAIPTPNEVEKIAAALDLPVYKVEALLDLSRD